MAITESKFSPEKRERLAEIAKLKAEREKRMLKLQKAVKKGKDNPSLYTGPKSTEGSTGDIVNRINRKGGGAALRGLGKAFMKGGKV
jgi:hypothetical protein